MILNFDTFIMTTMAASFWMIYFGIRKIFTTLDSLCESVSEYENNVSGVEEKLFDYRRDNTLIKSQLKDLKRSMEHVVELSSGYYDTRADTSVDLEFIRHAMEHVVECLDHVQSDVKMMKHSKITVVASNKKAYDAKLVPSNTSDTDDESTSSMEY
ncbi:MAG: hypothetical protein SGILL_006746 [Bacillariaceae sp.]